MFFTNYSQANFKDKLINKLKTTNLKELNKPWLNSDLLNNDFLDNIYPDSKAEEWKNFNVNAFIDKKWKL